MNKKSFQRKRYYIVTLLIAALTLFLSACQEKDDQFRILIFSNIPQDSIIKGKYVQNNGLEEYADFQIDLFPPVVERLIVEIVSHSGDVIIMERTMLAAVFDPEGLHSLNKVQSPTDKEEEKKLLAQDEQGELNLYALPLSRDLPMLKEMDLTSELVAVVPIYTNYKEEAIRFLDALVKMN